MHLTANKHTAQTGRALAFFSFIIALLSFLGVAYIWLINGAPKTIPNLSMIKNALSNDGLATDRTVEQESSQKAIADLQRELQRVTQQQQIIEQLGEQQQQQQHKIDSIANADRSQVLLDEIAYLLRIAVYRTYMAKDTSGAIYALNTADQLVGQQDDPRLLRLRESIAKDIASLKALGQFDSEKIYSQLSALASQVNNIPQFESPKFERSKQQQQMSEQQMLESLNKGADEQTETFAETVKNAGSRSAKNIWRLIGVNYYSDFEAQPLLSAAEHRIFKQNVSLLLEQAKLAVLNRKPKMFNDSLTQADSLLAKYGQKSTQARAIRDTIADLQAIDFKEQMPDISDSLSILHTLKGEASTTPKISVAVEQAQPDQVQSEASTQTQAGE